MSSKKKFYCGDKDEIPDGYERRGSRTACLRKGVGVGMYLKEKELREKYDIPARDPIEFDETEEDRELRFTREEKRGDVDIDKETYKEFIDSNFDKAKRNAMDIGDVFKQLAMLWKLEKKIEKERREEEEIRDEGIRDDIKEIEYKEWLY